MRVFRLVFAIVALAANSACADSDSRGYSCSYFPKASDQNPYPEIEMFRSCASLSDGNVTIRQEHLKNMDFDNGLAEVTVQGSAFYVNEEGKSAQVLRVDNGADGFSEGLARGIHNNKLGYIDRELNFVIQAKYDFGTQFSQGFALVCQGCSEVKREEHVELVDGDWGVIDKSGKIVVPIQLPRDEAEARRKEVSGKKRDYGLGKQG